MLVGAGAVAAWAVLGNGRQAMAATPKAVIHETKVISQQPQYYHGWPTVARCKSGELLLGYSGGREEHVCPFGRVGLMRSHDEGKTWSKPTVVLDMKIDARDAGVLETVKGTLLVSTFTSRDYVDLMAEAERIPVCTPGAWDPERLKRWQAARDRLTEDQRKALLGVWMIRSTDGGHTWSVPYDSLIGSPHGPIQLADGRLLYAGKDCNRTGKVGFAQSTDDGQTWRWLVEIPQRPGDNSLADYHELHAVEAADGRIVAQLRNHNTNNFLETLQTESSDGGKSWSEPHSIGVWGVPSHLLRLKDDRLLMTYGYRQPPLGNQARVSDDHGCTWSEAMTISGDGIGEDLGYPSTVQLADGSLLSVWYEVMKGSLKAVLRQSHWTLAGK